MRNFGAVAQFYSSLSPGGEYEVDCSVCEGDGFALTKVAANRRRGGRNQVEEIANAVQQLQVMGKHQITRNRGFGRIFKNDRSLLQVVRLGNVRSDSEQLRVEDCMDVD